MLGFDAAAYGDAPEQLIAADLPIAWLSWLSVHIRLKAFRGRSAAEFERSAAQVESCSANPLTFIVWPPHLDLLIAAR
jgi:hypothetical protein